MNKYLGFALMMFLMLSCGDDENTDLEDPTDDGPNEEVIDDEITDSFEGNGPLIDYVTNNPEALPDVARVDGRYRANLLENGDNQTLHYHEDQGRLDAKLVSFPFEFIARNIGIGTQEDSQTAPLPTNDPFNFAGVQVHHIELTEANSSHVVVGHRGSTHYTIEGKNTVDGNSSVNDVGANTAPDGRADIRIVGNEDRSITVYWQEPNLGDSANDNWILYNGTGELPGDTPVYGEEVYVGLITYAFYTTGVPFVGTCDGIDVK